MKFGVVVPFSDARLSVDMAVEIETADWDGLFLPEFVWDVHPLAQLAAAAVNTKRIRLGCSPRCRGSGRSHVVDRSTMAAATHSVRSRCIPRTRCSRATLVRVATRMAAG